MPRFNFTIKQLQYIEAAGRLGSIARAADEFNISQSSITSAIGGLESEVGFDLFIRTRSKGLQTTPGGDHILKLIRQLVDHVKQFEVEINDFGSVATGTVRIAIYGTTAPSFLPVILKSITENFPQIFVKIMEGMLQDVIECINRGDADLAFTYEMSTDAQHEFIPLLHAPTYALFSVNDPLASLDYVTLHQLSTHPMVMLDIPAARYHFMSIYENLNLKPRIAHTTQSSEIGRALVSAGFGHTLLNMKPAGYESDDPRFRAVPIKTPSEAPLFGIATVKGARQPEVVRTFIEHCVRIGNEGAYKPLIIEYESLE
ncbi:MAG: LysR substrate-binding domain-containing protein [Pseudomonadota bacterium]